MSMQITVTLPDEVVQRAEFWAQRAGRSVADLLAETIELSLQPLGGARAHGEKPIEDWSAEEVLAAAEASMPVAEDQRLSTLLDQQQARLLTQAERAELTALMQLYQERLWRKARALREAVQRGLREPLAS